MRSNDAKPRKVVDFIFFFSPSQAYFNTVEVVRFKEGETRKVVGIPINTEYAWGKGAHFFVTLSNSNDDPSAGDMCGLACVVCVCVCVCVSMSVCVHMRNASCKDAYFLVLFSQADYDISRAGR